MASLENPASGSAEPTQVDSRLRSALDTATCLVLPGFCAFRAVEDAGTAASEATAAAASDLASAGTGALRDAVRESAAPVAETASAIRYASVAATVIALVFLALVATVAAWYVWRQVKP